MQRALYWVLFAALLFPSAALAEMKLYRNIKNWTVSYNLHKQDCIAMSNHHYNGTHLIVRIPNYQADWQVGLHNKAWNVRNGRNYPIKVWIDGIPLLEGNARGFGSGGLSMHLSKGAPHARRFKSRFQRGNRMVVRGIGARKWIATLGLHGTSAAVDATIQCANYIRQLRRHVPPVASAGSQQQRSGFQFIKRSAMIALVANTLSKQGITGYRILPATPNNSAVKVQFTDGTRKTYLAASGNTKDADDYIDVVTADYRRQCKGNFAVSVRKIGTTTGDVRRVADMLCTQGTRTVKSILSVVRTPDGLLIATVTVPPITTSAPPPAKQKADQDRGDRA